MILIPAIDLKEGRCVRLRQGRMDDATIFGDDPADMAAHWRDQGARRLHVVDLDGAFAGEPKNRAVIESIVAVMGDVPVQIGGGIREVSVVRSYLEAGISQVIIGTKAIQEPQFLADLARDYPGQVILGLDARDGRVATDGWDETATIKALDVARDVAALPLFGIVYTDIERDGMLTGVNVPSTLAVAEASGKPVIASGGVTDLKDLDALAAASNGQLFGVISGRALYEQTLDLAAGQAHLDALLGG
ncbi:MAG: 1-(5-phosphoribosyl)-5-[(5-phosphoribosylamino)methylideneamino]imidazole-4-carboxamide isomerase [Pseudomonadaceae bacterium]|nr:1-(5-phosphoribosyl)-5-[(5-phosphoribosylamino)methylideneamino]imidazole-4-carboxamide isomerase [Pseudomonadaceae bacterium]